MKFETVDQIDDYIEQVRVKYEAKHNRAFELSNPHAHDLIEKLINIRMEVVMHTFEQSIDPTNIDSYVR
ncbi:hypothetical protein [Vibrio alginolyticus]|uniref:hypothetical protein n=1 Tax=Vibrio alginolyticus TaxID=663 RepID=UPI00384E51BB